MGISTPVGTKLTFSDGIDFAGSEYEIFILIHTFCAILHTYSYFGTLWDTVGDRLIVPNIGFSIRVPRVSHCPTLQHANAVGS